LQEAAMPNYDPKFKDITGQRFGRLLALEYVGTSRERYGYVKHRLAIWNCRCICGRELLVSGAHLRNGNTQSCGCLEKDLITKRNWKHGQAKRTHKSLTYRIWCGMITRCYNANRREFKYYGGRGIKVCKRWHKFANFFADMGPCPARYSIERVNNDGNYTPSNCKWIPQREQAKNQRGRKGHLSKNPRDSRKAPARSAARSQ
jgi:hypothetical protein